MGQWYIARGKVKLGPYSLAQMQSLAATGELDGADMVLPPGMQKWAAAQSLSDLFPMQTSASTTVTPTLDTSFPTVVAPPSALPMAAKAKPSAVPWKWLMLGAGALGVVMTFVVVPVIVVVVLLARANRPGELMPPAQAASLPVERENIPMVPQVLEETVQAASPDAKPAVAIQTQLPSPPAEAKTAAPSEETVFFNGKDLTGWQGLSGRWKVVDGAIVGIPSRGVHTFLCSVQTYQDFELKFKVRRKNGIGNTGVQFRSVLENRERFTVLGPQVEIDTATFRYPPGSIVTERSGSPFFKSNTAAIAKVWKETDFNDMSVHCQGKHVIVKVNGVVAVDTDMPSMPDQGIIAWQLHGGTAQTAAPEEIVFKDIQFTDLSPKRTRSPEAIAKSSIPKSGDKNPDPPLKAKALPTPAKGLDPSWIALSEAASAHYYRNNVRSDFIRYAARLRLPDLEKNGDEDQQKAAQYLTGLFGKLDAAEYERMMSGLNPGNDRERLNKFILNGLLDPNNADKAFDDHLKSTMDIVNNFAKAQMEVTRQEITLRGLWRKLVLDTIKKNAGPSTDQPLIEVKVGVLRRDLWMSAKNTSPRTLHNCTFVIAASLGSYSYLEQAVFVREWPAGQTIYPQFWTSGPIIPTERESAIVDSVKAQVELWCDEAHMKSSTATAVNGYEIRDPLMLGLLAPGSRYFHVSASKRSILEFTGFDKNAAGYALTAAITRTPLDGGQPVTTKYFGNWIENKNNTISFHPNLVKFYMDPGERRGRTDKELAKTRKDHVSVRWDAGKLSVSQMAGPFASEKLDMIPISTTK